jgi:hypothetical protein
MLALLPPLFYSIESGFIAAYQQPLKYNFAVTREVLKHVYTAERLQPPTSLGAVLGTYSTLWARARSIGYWRDVVRSGEYARLGVYAIEAYGIFKVRFSVPLSLFVVLNLSAFSCRLERSSVVGHSWGITCSRAARDDVVLNWDFRHTPPSCCKSTDTRFNLLKFQISNPVIESRFSPKKILKKSIRRRRQNAKRFDDDDINNLLHTRFPRPEHAPTRVIL